MSTEREIGAQLANVAFNWAQRCGYTLTSDDCAMLDKLRKDWDRTCPACVGAPAPADERGVFAREPTEEMLRDAQEAIFEELPHWTIVGREELALNIWHAMTARAWADSTPAPAVAAVPEGMVQDALRYRWLRDIGDATWAPIAKHAGITSAHQIDNAIDEAIAAAQEKT